MRNTALAVGLFVCSLIALSTTKTSALSPAELVASTSLAGYAAEQADTPDADQQDVATIMLRAVTEAPKTASKPSESKQDKQAVHVVREGDSLTTIAKAHGTSWQRLYDKNTSVQNPDTIKIGQKIAIPKPDEKLKKREWPNPIAQPSAQNYSQSANQAAAASRSTTSLQRGSSAGNSYYAGYCTWYAKSRRPDMPNNLGNANTWVARAAAQGFATGSTPRAGAIGQQGMHVVYVERVNANGTVTVSEMNYQGYGVVSSRTVPASTFMYIY